MATGAQHKSFISVGTLHYELNNWVTFAYEQALDETNAVPPGPTGALPLFNGIPSRTWRDLRSEGAPSLRSSCRRSAGRGCCKHFRPAEKTRRGSFKRLTRAPAQ